MICRSGADAVRVRQDGATLTGFAARDQAAGNPLNTFSSVKRLIGRRYEDVRDRAEQLPYCIAASSGGRSCTPHGAGAASTGLRHRSAAARSKLAEAELMRGALSEDGTSAAHAQEKTADDSRAAAAGLARTDAPDAAGRDSRPGEADTGSGAVMLECPAMGRLLAPEEVSAALMRELADRARRHLNADLTGAVSADGCRFKLLEPFNVVRPAQQADAVAGCCASSAAAVNVALCAAAALRNR